MKPDEVPGVLLLDPSDVIAYQNASRRVKELEADLALMRERIKTDAALERCAMLSKMVEAAEARVALERREKEQQVAQHGQTILRLEREEATWNAAYHKVIKQRDRLREAAKAYANSVDTSNEGNAHAALMEVIDAEG